MWDDFVKMGTKKVITVELKDADSDPGILSERYDETWGIAT